MLADLHASAPDAWRDRLPTKFQPSWRPSVRPLWRKPAGHPQNLFLFVNEVAIGRRAQLQVFGGDWPIQDGTGVHDTIDVMDLAEGHRAALDCLLAEEQQLLPLNLNLGSG